MKTATQEVPDLYRSKFTLIEKTLFMNHTQLFLKKFRLQRSESLAEALNTQFGFTSIFCLRSDRSVSPSS